MEFSFLLPLVFLFGTIIGSFLNVIIDRADTKESPLKGVLIVLIVKNP
jgi:prepilin signal peptidase PulO-like enzyme (type II secretory pathway)